MMSIYAKLLDNALDQSQPDPDSTIGDVLAQLLEHRDRLGTSVASHTEFDWAPAAIADQLAYDVSLIELSRRLGIEADLTRFGQPQSERARLEHALVSRGIRLDRLDTPSQKPQRAWGQR
jgi:hypothetical protein